VSYLVDANVRREATRPAPNARVLEWLRRNERTIVIDPIILGEIRFGIDLLPAGKRRRRLERWFDEHRQDRLRSLGGGDGASLGEAPRGPWQVAPIKDSLIAASALVRRLTVVTRNTRDLETAGVRVFDPFA